MNLKLYFYVMLENLDLYYNVFLSFSLSDWGSKEHGPDSQL